MAETAFIACIVVFFALLFTQGLYQVWHGAKSGHAWGSDERGMVCTVCGARPWIL